MGANSDTPFLDALRVVAAAHRDSDTARLNQALSTVGDLLRSRFVVMMARELAGLSGGRTPDGLLEDAEAVVNDVLLKVWKTAGTMRGATEAEAEAWFVRVIQNRLIDLRKTPLRRRGRWQEWLDNMGAMFQHQRLTKPTEDEANFDWDRLDCTDQSANRRLPEETD